MNIHLSLTNTNRSSKLLFIVVVFSFFSCENEKKQSEKKTIERVNPARYGLGRKEKIFTRCKGK